MSPSHSPLPLLALAALGAALGAPAAPAAVWSVADSAALQAALGAAQPGDLIQCAPGTYLPSHETLPGVPQTATFDVPGGVAIVGAGPGATILSGELGGPGPFDNARCVLTIRQPGVRLAHLTVTHAYGPGAAAAIHCVGGEVLLNDCELTDNATGGGALLVVGGSAALTGCSITGGDGLGIVSAIEGQEADVRLTRCLVAGNYDATGGAVNLFGGSASIVDTTFAGNGALSGPGALGFGGGTLDLRGCTFVDNAGTLGPGAMDVGDAAARVADCTFVGNVSALALGLDVGGRGGAVRVGGGIATFTGCRFAGNRAFATPRHGGRGGAVYVDAGDATFSGCAFVDNAAGSGADFPDSPGQGSAAFIVQAAAYGSFERCSFTHNAPLGTAPVVFGPGD